MRNWCCQMENYKCMKWNKLECGMGDWQQPEGNYRNKQVSAGLLARPWLSWLPANGQKFRWGVNQIIPYYF